MMASTHQPTLKNLCRHSPTVALPSVACVFDKMLHMNTPKFALPLVSAADNMLNQLKSRRRWQLVPMVQDTLQTTGVTDAPRQTKD